MAPLVMAVVLFPGFELLDVTAPGEVLGSAPDLVELVYCCCAGEARRGSAREGLPVAMVPSSCMELCGGSPGPALCCTHAIVRGGKIAPLGDSAGGEPRTPGAIFVPGGKGVRQMQHDPPLLEWLRDAATRSAETELVFTVCTGSWLLASSGALDGIRATSNKAALQAGHPQRCRPQVRLSTTHTNRKPHLCSQAF